MPWCVNSIGGDPAGELARTAYVSELAQSCEPDAPLPSSLIALKRFCLEYAEVCQNLPAGSCKWPAPGLGNDLRQIGSKWTAAARDRQGNIPADGNVVTCAIARRSAERCHCRALGSCDMRGDVLDPYPDVLCVRAIMPARCRRGTRPAGRRRSRRPRAAHHQACRTKTGNCGSSRHND